MTEKETTSGGALWRKRAVATVSVAAAVAAGGFALASAADAAPLPTLTLAAPAQVFNAGTSSAAQTLSVTFNNSALGAAAQTGVFTVSITNVPAGVACTSITLTPSVGSDALTPVTGTPAGTCSFQNTATAVPASTTNKVDSYTYSINTVSPGNPNGATGTLSETATYTIGSPNTTTVTSNTATTALVGASSPSVLGTPPAATVYKAYNFKLFNVGSPAATTTITASSGAAPVAANCPTTRAGAGTANCYTLNDNLIFDAVDGTIARDASNTYTVDLLPISYTITETNSSGTAKATVTIPVLFSDVPTSNPFFRAIYSLGHSDVLGGYLDGTFRPATSISRQAFAHIIYTGLFENGAAGGNTDGACNPFFNPSLFSDVPNSSPFCVSINSLASAGVIDGYSDGKFHPAASISRQAIAAFLFRIDNLDSANHAPSADAECTTPTGFNDVSPSNKFCGDIEYLVSQGFAKGYADGGFHPGAEASRQAVAQMVYTNGKAKGVAYPYARRK